MRALGGGVRELPCSFGTSSRRDTDGEKNSQTRLRWRPQSLGRGIACFNRMWMDPRGARFTPTCAGRWTFESPSGKLPRALDLQQEREISHIPHALEKRDEQKSVILHKPSTKRAPAHETERESMKLDEETKCSSATNSSSTPPLNQGWRELRIVVYAPLPHGRRWKRHRLAW